VPRPRLRANDLLKKGNRKGSCSALSVSFAVIALLHLVSAQPGILFRLPADTHANARTKAIYAFIVRLKTRPNKRILSGQNVNVRGNAHITNDDELFARPEKARRAHTRPDRRGLQTTPATMAVRTKSFQRYAESEGCFVSVCGGLRNPGIAQGDFAGLLPGGAQRGAWVEEMDMLAEQLRYFQDRGTTVLFRPFHEMNGSWCWYYAKDPETFPQSLDRSVRLLHPRQGAAQPDLDLQPNNDTHGEGSYAKDYPGAAMWISSARMCTLNHGHQTTTTSQGDETSRSSIPSSVRPGRSAPAR